MKSPLLRTLAATCLVALAGQSFAGPVSIFQVSNPGTGVLVNTTTNDIKINAKPGVLIGAMQLLVHLTSGHFFEHQVQSPDGTPPNGAFFQFFPELAYDSFIAAGSYTNDQSPLVLGPSLELGGPAGPDEVFTATTYDVSYGPPLGQDNAGRQGYLAARLTFSNDARGTFKFKVDFSDGTSAGSGFATFGILPIGTGVVIPEPTSAWLCGLAALCVLTVARRRG